MGSLPYTYLIGRLMSIRSLPTPALLLDRQRLETNIDRLARHLARLGRRLRPHFKTSKSWEVLRLALDRDRPAATVSTLAEARLLAGKGVRDVLYAVGIAPDKLDEAARLQAQGIELTVILDSVAAAEMIAARAAALGTCFRVAIEIDADGHRSGVRSGDPELRAIARALHLSKTTMLAGVVTHAGESYSCRGTEALEAAAAAERDAAVEAAAIVRAATGTCDMVSVGSTPTALFARDLQGITEVRAGVYMFQDLVMAGIDVCRVDEIALSVLCSVIGWQREKGWVLTDAGWTALSRDRGTARQTVDQRYGLVCDVDGTVLPDVLVDSTSQEHGILVHRNGEPLSPEDFPLGRKLRILPNHACATASQHDHYHVVVRGTVTAVWPRMRGW